MDSNPGTVCEPHSNRTLRDPEPPATRRNGEKTGIDNHSAGTIPANTNGDQDQPGATAGDETAASRLVDANLAKSRCWEQFVGKIAETANPALVSLLRNSVILALDPDRLVIGYHNLNVFSEEKKSQIEVAARSFFGPRLTVSYQESDIGLGTSLQKKQDQERKKAAALRKEQARSDARVQALLAVFPDCEIREIIIEDEMS